jgi:DNA gyrase/topoisomerase IV subunit A
MVADIEQDTVDWRDNFDGSLQEPVTLPTKFPNHLCNGTMGIAVGMATNMAPHNITEVLDASLLLLEKEGKQLTVEQKAQKEKDIAADESIEIEVDADGNELKISDKYIVSVDEIMEIIKGPDFPTG